MKYSLICLTTIFSLLMFSLVVDAKELAITFDDSPRFASGFLDGETRSKMLIKAIERSGIPEVAFFTVSSRLDAEGKERLKRYNDAGHIIANHTHTHLDINKRSLSDFQSDFLQAHNELKDFSNFRRWFRFPYLREGNTAYKRDGMRVFLQKSDYTNMYITMNNYDWYIESLFQQAIKNGYQIEMEKMKAFYVSTLMEGIRYYDELAIKHLGRSPKHILLLHEMDISALFISDLVGSLRQEGWSIISPSEALKDPIANYHTKDIMRFNPGRIGEIAKEKGQRKALWHYSLNEDYLKKKFEENVLVFSEKASFSQEP